MGKKLTNLNNRYISINTDIDEKRFTVFEHTINHLSFGYVRLPQLKPEVESRTQGSRPRPRTQKKSEAKTKDRHSRGQGQECSRPRTQAQVLS